MSVCVVHFCQCHCWKSRSFAVCFQAQNTQCLWNRHQAVWRSHSQMPWRKGTQLNRERRALKTLSNIYSVMCKGIHEYDVSLYLSLVSLPGFLYSWSWRPANCSPPHPSLSDTPLNPPPPQRWKTPLKTECCSATPPSTGKKTVKLHTLICGNCLPTLPSRGQRERARGIYEANTAI